MVRKIVKFNALNTTISKKRKQGIKHFNTQLNYLDFFLIGEFFLFLSLRLHHFSKPQGISMGFPII